MEEKLTFPRKLHFSAVDYDKVDASMGVHKLSTVGASNSAYVVMSYYAQKPFSLPIAVCSSETRSIFLYRIA